MYLLIYILFTFILTTLASKTHEFNWDISWVDSNPDGLHPRRMIGINNQWPLPTIRVSKHDRVIIHITNNLGDRNTSLHFHGLFMKGYAAHDGPEFVTQCPIPPGATFTHDFNVGEQTGTFWYHSHTGSQYGDGLRGIFIIEDDYGVEYDEEVVLSIGDHYHLESLEIMKSFKSRFNPTGAEPIPQSSLFNETRNVTWEVQPDKTYLLRLVNMGLFVSHYVYIEDHSFTILEVDGIKVEPYTVESLYISVAQRYVVLVHTKAKSQAKPNYRFVNIFDQEMLDFIPVGLELVSTNWVVYDKSEPLLKPLPPYDYDKAVDRLTKFNDFHLRPVGDIKLLPEPDITIQVNFSMEVLGDGVTYALFNGKTYTPPKVPTLYSVLSSGEQATNQLVYGTNTNSFIIQGNEVVDIVLNNHDPGKHPFHLHGHAFQVISRFNTDDEENPISFDPSNKTMTNYPKYPLIRDTAQVEPNGFIVLRFQSNNPGVWFFHCHLDWHLEQGLAILLIEDPMELQKSQSKIPQNHIDVCNAAGVPYKGNAAGNAEDFLDLTGENLQFKDLPLGFTLKGYIAFSVCTLFAIYGLFSIYKYGMEDVSKDNSIVVIERLYRILEEYDNN